MKSVNVKSIYETHNVKQYITCVAQCDIVPLISIVSPLNVIVFNHCSWDHIFHEPTICVCVYVCVISN